MSGKATFLTILSLKELNALLEILGTLKGKYSICLADLGTRIEFEKIDSCENTILIWRTKTDQSISYPKVEQFFQCVKLYFGADGSFDPTVECNTNALLILQKLGEDETPSTNPPDMLPPIKTQKLDQNSINNEENNQMWIHCIQEWLRAIGAWKKLVYPLFKIIKDLDSDGRILRSIRQLNAESEDLRKSYENNFCEEYYKKLKEHGNRWSRIYEECELLEEKLPTIIKCEKEIKKEQEEDVYYSPKKRFY